MSAYDNVKKARDSERPTAIKYIEQIFTDVTFLHGDRRFADDGAIIAGIGMLDEMPVTFIGIERGTDLESRIKANFGSPKPEGYRKALRLMKQAEKFGRPVVCFVDTSGAYCGEDAEERGQGQAIAENLMEMMGLKTPVISIIIGEGGSGGALGLAVADRVYMMENSIYSVISPEGCASILWRDASKTEEAADALHITAADIRELGVAEGVFREDLKRFPFMCKVIRSRLLKDFRVLLERPMDIVLENRYMKFRKLGVYEENAD